MIKTLIVAALAAMSLGAVAAETVVTKTVDTHHEMRDQGRHEGHPYRHDMGHHYGWRHHRHHRHVVVVRDTEVRHMHRHHRHHMMRDGSVDRHVVVTKDVHSH